MLALAWVLAYKIPLLASIQLNVSNQTQAKGSVYWRRLHNAAAAQRSHEQRD